MNPELIPDFTVKVPSRPWHDHAHWTAALAASADKQDVLYRWVASAGGFIEGGTATLPALPAGPARTALVGALKAHLGVSARAGAAFRLPDFGRELRMREVGPTARLVVRFQMEALASRGSERVVRGRVHEGGGFSITIITTQPETELEALHHRHRGSLLVGGSLDAREFKRRDAAMIPVVGLVSGAAA